MIVSVRWPTRGNSQDDVATEEAQIWPVTKPGNVRLVAEPRPLVYRDGAIRIYIDAVAPKARSAIHEKHFDEGGIVAQRHKLQRRTAPPDILHIRGLARVRGSESSVAGSGAGGHQ